MEKVEIKSRGHVRRSRLYYLRGLRGKKARLQSKVRNLSGLVAAEDEEAVEAGGAGVAEAAVENSGEAPAEEEAGVAEAAGEAEEAVSEEAGAEAGSDTEAAADADEDADGEKAEKS